MHSTTIVPQRASSLARTVMGSILSKLVNQHTKRIIFISSLYARISRIDRLQQSAVEKLNQLMVLATNEKSLTFSARFHGLVWRGTGITTVLSPENLRPLMSEDQRRELSAQVVDMAPRCLRYGKSEMIRDVQRLLFQSNDLVTVPETTVY